VHLRQFSVALLLRANSDAAEDEHRIAPVDGVASMMIPPPTEVPN
jgi:hypothetical protein